MADNQLLQRKVKMWRNEKVTRLVDWVIAEGKLRDDSKVCKYTWLYKPLNLLNTFHMLMGMLLLLWSKGKNGVI